MLQISHGQGRTVLIVSNNLFNIIHLCDSAIILNNGCISYLGDTNSAMITETNRRTKNCFLQKLLPT